ncbi:hypothetical protein ASPNIDRAFT_45383 [Aspergillus niger ATCC 1015]|uniref:Uncharacterized protein n=1 Tax=Aspergillus niger (strain ATCC 1015 / CBS 113.46 / FGSC A1144 / LSHB Ac4 / NCTC 3858a / NRRL 328 / USDA 3528.7) TaxID=380704 RepID=G3Y9E7_ASPNA|nr:hypothetical protein ASPNIDRAFT_45383 [Aspergillus niger ATCC 1015]
MMDSRDLVVYRIGTSPAHDIVVISWSMTQSLWNRNRLSSLTRATSKKGYHSEELKQFVMLDANGIEDSTFQAVTKGPVLFQRILVQRPVKGAMDIVGRPMWVVNFIVPIFRGSKKPSVDQRSDFIGLMATSVEQ